MDNKKNGIPKLRFPGFTGAWEQRKLGEVGKTFTGLSGKTKEDFGHGDAHFVTYMNVYSNPISDPNMVENVEIDTKQQEVKKGDVFFTTSSETPEEVGMSSVWLSDAPHIYLNSFCFGFRPTVNIFHPYYLAYLLRSNNIRNKMMILAQGISRYNISKNKVMKLNVTIPNIREQQKIGEFFKQLDFLITLHQRKLEHLQEQKKGLLQKMFPKNGEIVPEVRFPGFTDAWEQRKLGEVVNFLDTLRKPLEGAKRVKGPYPYYGASGIVDYVDGYLFDEELILLSEDGANITERNYPVCFLASGKYWVNNHAHVLKIKEDNDNNFICNSLERKDYTKYNTGMAMPKLNKETCKGIPIMCPNYDEQKKIGNYFRKFDTLIALHQRKLDHLELMKKGLLQQMFV